MIDWRINRHGNSCRIEIELPWDLATRILAATMPLFDQLRPAVDVHQAEERRQAEELRRTSEARQQRRRETARLGRIAYSRFRHERMDRPNDPGAERRRALAKVAEGLSVPAQLLEVLIRQHRQKLNARVERARVAKTISLLRQGAGNAEIAAVLAIRPHNVPRWVRKAREQMGLPPSLRARKGGGA
ncbi:MAG: hypothetical protein H3C38_04285 [Rhodospirillales bacterium]|nr:hypothetical protein [Rhodospirillales bacterium]